MRTLLVIYTVIIAVHAGLPITWLRVREDDVIKGTQQVTHMLTSTPSLITCGYTCGNFDWCSVFVADDLAGTCELRDLPRISLNFSTSPHSSYCEVLAFNEWCPVDDGFQFSTAAHLCFILVTTLNATWNASRNECKRRGLDLVLLDTTLKLNIVLKTIKKTPGGDIYSFFLGATRPMTDLSKAWNGTLTRFDWINGVPISITKGFWAANEPNGWSQNCLAVEGKYGALLNDVTCSDRRYFVCEKSEPIR